jgi:predicted phosphoribosyltransferase
VVDELVCLEAPEPFRSVGLWYREFAQVEDEEVVEMLAHTPATV